MQRKIQESGQNELTEMISENDLNAAPCLRRGRLAHEWTDLVTAARDMGIGKLGSIVRTWSVPYLFSSMERVFNSGEDPVQSLRAVIIRLGDFYRAILQGGLSVIERDIVTEKEANSRLLGIETVESATGEHFGQLFKELSTDDFWAKPLPQFRTRLERNGIDPSIFEGKDVLDLGCGSGRIAFAIRELGAKEVVGVDISEAGMSAGRKRIEQLGIRGVKLEQGNVLKLQYPDNAFDVVFTSGVFHHTEDWRLGVSEMVRVLRPGGIGLIMYLAENPGGIFWDVIEILRVILSGENRDLARGSLQLLGVAPERIIYMLDMVMVPICVRLTPEEIRMCLSEAGATEIRRFERGADSDRIERRYRGEPYAEVKFGVGENRFVFSKD